PQFVIARPVRTLVVAISGFRFVRSPYFLHEIATAQAPRNDKRGQPILSLQGAQRHGHLLTKRLFKTSKEKKKSLRAPFPEESLHNRNKEKNESRGSAI
ncbi:MAG: hypothetical protein ACI4V3_01385, partial [Faecousia sp.]